MNAPLVSVYFAQGLASGRLKIGQTGCIPERLKGVANKLEPVALIGSLAAPASMERELHQRFAASLDPTRGREWFHDDGPVRAFVEALPASQRGWVEFHPNAPRGGRRSAPKYPRTSALLFPVDSGPTIGTRLRALRLVAGVTPSELGRLAGLKSAAHVGMIENNDARGRGLAASTAILLSKALGCTFRHLAFGTDDAPTPDAIARAVSAARTRSVAPMAGAA